MARRKISAQQVELHVDNVTEKSVYTEAADEVNSKEKLQNWFTRGANDAKVYLMQLAGETLSKGYIYNETIWLITTQKSDQALVEYKRGFASLVKI